MYVCVQREFGGTSQTVLPGNWFLLQGCPLSPLLTTAGPSPLCLQRVQRTGTQDSHPESLHYLWPVVEHSPSLQPTSSLSHLSQANYQHYRVILKDEVKRSDGQVEDERKSR